MKIGYARVSTDEQNLDLQLDALKEAGCDQVFSDEGVSGAGNPHKRAGFAEAMAVIDAGDTFTVWKLDRLARSLKQLIETGRSGE
jgi:DNA invertase Pin-like site-specific DNA recombinase